MDLKVVSACTLATRARTVRNLVNQGAFMRALKIIRITMHNLDNSDVPDMTDDQVNRYYYLFGCSALYANRGHAAPIVEYMQHIMDDIATYNNTYPSARELRFEDLPPVVRRSIAFAF